MLVWVFEIEFSSMGKNIGNPDLVCKKSKVCLNFHGLVYINPLYSVRFSHSFDTKSMGLPIQ